MKWTEKHLSLVPIETIVTDRVRQVKRFTTPTLSLVSEGSLSPIIRVGRLEVLPIRYNMNSNMNVRHLVGIEYKLLFTERQKFLERTYIKDERTHITFGSLFKNV